MMRMLVMPVLGFSLCPKAFGIDRCLRAVFFVFWRVALHEFFAAGLQLGLRHVGLIGRHALAAEHVFQRFVLFVCAAITCGSRCWSRFLGMSVCRSCGMLRMLTLSPVTRPSAETVFPFFAVCPSILRLC